MMRATTFFVPVVTGALLALGTSASPALAAAPTPALNTIAPATALQQEAGWLNVSSSTVAPGQTVGVTGTCPTPPAGAPTPVLLSVTSDAFVSPAVFSRNDPMAFVGKATITQNPARTSHQVLLRCSNGVAVDAVTVTGGAGPAPAQPTAPAHHQTGPSHEGVEAGTEHRPVVREEDQQRSGLPWGWITAGALVVAGAGAATAFGVSRRRSSATPNDEQPRSRTGV